MALHACAQCHQKIPADVHAYTMKIELFPRIEESLEISEADLDKDLEAELANLIEQMNAMDAEEVKEEEEHIYSSFTFVVCPSCRDELASRLRRQKTLPWQES